MKFIVGKTALLDAVTMVGKCVSTNTVLPILENFLFSVADGQLTVTSSDLQTTMGTVVNIESQDIGLIAVPSRILLEVLKTLPEQPLKFEIDETTFAVEITAGDGSFNLAGDNAANFPKIPVVETPSFIELPAPILSEAIAKTLFAVSGDELRPAMTGVLCSLTPDAMTFVSTDAAKLVRYIRLNTGAITSTSFILPKKALVLLKASLPADDIKVSVEYNQTSAFFHFGKVSVICRLIDEKYPAYETIIPTECPNVMIIDRISFLNTLQRVAIFANKTSHQVKLEIDNNKLTLSGEDCDFSSKAKDIIYCQYAAEPITIGFNAKLLMEILRNIDTEEVSVKMSQANRAALILPVDGNESEDLLMLLMPLIVN
jgi:DNA polymerase-3 subunit beta